jgi:hypothetical protein
VGHGLESASAFFPLEPDAAGVSVGIYQFRDEDSLHAALASAETHAVMADVPRHGCRRVSGSEPSTLIARASWPAKPPANGTRRSTSFLRSQDKRNGISDPKIFVVGGSRRIGPVGCAAMVTAARRRLPRRFRL